MAISCSAEWSLACTNCCRATQHLHAVIPTCHFPSWCTVSPSHPRFFHVNFSASPTPILEEEPSNTPIIHFDVNFAGVQQYSKPEAENLNEFLCGLFEDPKTRELAFDYYQRLKERPEFRPNKSTLRYVIRYLMSLKEWDLILSVSEDFKVYHVLPDRATCSSLIKFCIKRRKFRIADVLLDAFNSDTKVAFLACSSAMGSYNKLHMFRNTVLLYERMKSTGILLDSVGYLHIMEAYSKLNECDKVVQLFHEFKSRKLRTSARYLSQIYGILCESLGKFGRAFEALDYFREMTRKGISEHSIYSTLIYSFASLRKVDVAEELFREAKSKTVIKDPEVYLRLMLMYIDEGLLEKTLEILKAMDDADVKVSDSIICTIVNGFSKKRGFSAAVNVFEDLVSKGYEPGQVTYASVINAYWRLGQCSKAEEVFVEMEQRGFDKCVYAYSSMIVMYGRTGKVGSATRLMAKMKERGCKPNVWIYNSLIDMHGREKDLKQLEKLWREMKRRKVAPDKVTYTTIISAYNKAGEFESCVKVFDEYRMNGGLIDRAMAGIMVGVYTKIGQVDDLVKLLQDMKTEGTRLDQRLYQSAWNAFKDAGLQLQAKWMKESFLVA
ncbi:pentatricopeptide repeat-containing protein At5g13770, chloroplastic [Vigna unguiculata]|uniref:Structure-specific endonuclease subunit SLX1 n=1 Tax=Vigna unguiculata TaxID=3917 RepID=A0A4D6LMF5_VIGUN|nr:pentatricopeptide repeat-containing protein At5g13770, chloroplastic [Vigna unguiculata]QCD89426.1 structure-specific endonuclease subunit SLX1 [Vigna unguiculata]